MDSHFTNVEHTSPYYKHCFDPFPFIWLFFLHFPLYFPLPCNWPSVLSMTRWRADTRTSAPSFAYHIQDFSHYCVCIWSVAQWNFSESCADYRVFFFFLVLTNYTILRRCNSVICFKAIPSHFQDSYILPTFSIQFWCSSLHAFYKYLHIYIFPNLFFSTGIV